MVLYSVLHSLGAEVEVLPVVIGHGYKDIESDYWGDSEDSEDNKRGTNNTSRRRGRSGRWTMMPATYTMNQLKRKVGCTFNIPPRKMFQLPV